jgi:hypothetical protein
MNCVEIILVLLFIIFIVKYDSIEGFVSMKKVCNNVDKRCYNIVGKYEDSTHEDASELLAYLNRYCIDMLRHLREKYLFKKQGTKYRQEMVKFLLENYNPDSLIENAPITSENTSYVEDKGKVFAICLREKLTGKEKFHNKNILEFVVLHEITHMATKEMGHDLPFWTNFKIILEEAVNLNMHKPTDYSKFPDVYCSLELNYNPYFDKNLPNK